MKILFKVFLFLLLVLLMFVASTALGFFAGGYGARIGGLTEGGWNYHLILPFIGGGLVAAYVSFVCFSLMLGNAKISIQYC